jgi:hypothetical protein
LIFLYGDVLQKAQLIADEMQFAIDRLIEIDTTMVEYLNEIDRIN